MKEFCVTLLFLLLAYIQTAVGVDRTCFRCMGINCLRTATTSSVKCQDIFDDCVTVFQNDTVIEKGCLSEISTELQKKCSNSENLECKLCKANLCNNLGSIVHNCIQCDSRKDINCKTNILNLKAKSCPSSTSMHSYCFAKILADKNVIRGCSVDTLSQKVCLSDEKCFLCLPKDMPICNNINITSNNNENNSQGGGGAIWNSITTTLFILTILIQI